MTDQIHPVHNLAQPVATTTQPAHFRIWTIHFGIDVDTQNPIRDRVDVDAKSFLRVRVRRGPMELQDSKVSPPRFALDGQTRIKIGMKAGGCRVTGGRCTTPMAYAATGPWERRTVFDRLCWSCVHAVRKHFVTPIRAQRKLTVRSHARRRPNEGAGIAAFICRRAAPSGHGIARNRS
jgi:hypothetical protein